MLLVAPNTARVHGTLWPNGRAFPIASCGKPQHERDIERNSSKNEKCLLECMETSRCGFRLECNVFGRLSLAARRIYGHSTKDNRSGRFRTSSCFPKMQESPLEARRYPRGDVSGVVRHVPCLEVHCEGL